LSRLSDVVCRRIDNIRENGLTILIGDAHGADKAVQAYLAKQEYPNVVIYCTGGECRNNLGNWQIVSVPYAGKKRSYDYYVAKDIAMADAAQWGLMLWDGESKGTFRNIVDLLHQSKKTAVFYSPQKAIITLSNPTNLLDWLNRIGKASFSHFSKDISRSVISMEEQWIWPSSL